jgi:hypothetical protein
MTTAAMMALKKNQFVRLPLNLQGEAAQWHATKGCVNMDIIGTNHFASDIGDSLGEVILMRPVPPITPSRMSDAPGNDL